MNRRSVKLYNVIFPIWLLWVIPVTWVVVLPANLIIDGLVILLSKKFLKLPDFKIRSVLLYTWVFGFLSDFIGTLCMFTSNLISPDTQTRVGNWWYDHITNAVSYDPFQNVYSLLWVTACVIITACFIYFFNYRYSFKKLDLTYAQRKKLSLSLAVFTAPYLFYLPTVWFL